MLARAEEQMNRLAKLNPQWMEDIFGKWDRWNGSYSMLSRIWLVRSLIDAWMMMLAGTYSFAAQSDPI